MAITILNPARFNDDGGAGTRRFIRAAFFDEGYGSSTSFAAYAQGAGIVPNTAAFNAIGAGTAGDPLRMSQFSGFTVPSLVSFTPAGGASAGAAVFVNSDVAFEEAEVVISCNQNATWNYTRTFTSGTGTQFVSLSTGGVGTSIIFRCDGDFGTIGRRTFSLNATAGGITQYWTVDLRSEYV
jgi:hypothetical protein